eukprot:Opistho-2@3940
MSRRCIDDEGNRNGLPRKRKYDCPTCVYYTVGDSVLRLATSIHVYRTNPAANEAQLSAARVSLLKSNIGEPLFRRTLDEFERRAHSCSPSGHCSDDVRGRIGHACARMGLVECLCCALNVMSDQSGNFETDDLLQSFSKDNPYTEGCNLLIDELIKRGLQGLSQDREDVRFNRRLEAALTHPSCEGLQNYQRLEFLGDAAIGAIASLSIARLHLYAISSGELTLARGRLVCNESLAIRAVLLGIPRLIRFGDKSLEGNAEACKAAHADSLEATFGALVDCGYIAGIVSVWASFGDDAVVPADGASEDALGGGDPFARVTKSFPGSSFVRVGAVGPAHSAVHTVRIVGADGTPIASGAGSSFKKARLAAARAALLTKQDA